MKAKIIITEAIYNALLNEAIATKHFFDRMDRMWNLDIEKEDISITRQNLKKVMLYQFPVPQFPQKLSFAIRLHRLKVNPNSEFKVYYKNDRRLYYKLVEDDNSGASIGDEFWVIVRENKITSFLLRKSAETEKGKDFLKNLLKVDQVFFDVKNIEVDSNNNVINYF